MVPVISNQRLGKQRIKGVSETTTLQYLIYVDDTKTVELYPTQNNNGIDDSVSLLVIEFRESFRTPDCTSKHLFVKQATGEVRYNLPSDGLL